MSEFKKEDRYLVIKRTDMLLANSKLSQDEIDTFNKVTDVIMMARDEQGKPPLNCVVVESDWPEYDTVWNMIEKRVLNG